MKTYKDLQENLKKACWKGYEAIGMKKKNGKMVPNCVPKEETEIEESDAAYAAAIEKQKENKLTKKDQGTMGKIRDLMAKEKAKKLAKEEVEQIDELDKKTLASYTSKSHDQLMKHTASVNMKYGRGDKDATAYALDKDALRKTANRTKGMQTALKKLAKEETQLDEGFLGDLVASYKKGTVIGLRKGLRNHIKPEHHDKYDIDSVLTKDQAKEKLKSAQANGHLKLKEEVELIEGKMKELHSDIEDHLGKHVANYKKMGGAEHLGNKSVEVAKKLAKLHNISHAAAQKHVNDYIDNNLKEEYLDEISKDTLHSYIHKAFAQGNDLHYDLAHSRGNKATDAERKALRDKISKRNTGIIKAGKKLREDVSMLSLKDFVKEGFVSAAQRKAVWASKNEKGIKEEELDEVMTPMQKLRDAHERHYQKALAANKAGDDEATKVHQKYMQKITDKMNKLKRNEEIDLTEMENLCEISKSTLGSYVKKAADDYSKRDTRISHALDRNLLDPNVDKAVAKQDKRKAGMHKAIDKLTKEEVEELDEISKSTLASYIPKAAKSARYSGQIATDFEKRADSARKNSTKASWKNLATKYKKKAWDREDNIAKAANKLAKEENLDELSKKTLNSYVSKTGKDLDRAMDAMPHGTGDDKEDRKLNNRLVGNDRAQARLMKKEEVMVSYKDFVATLNEELKGKQHKLDKNKNGKLDAHDFKLLRKEEEEIEEGKIDDLKDKIAAKKATMSAYDKGYKPEPKSNVVKVKGHSYGAGEEEGEDDDDNKKVIKKPSEPEVKRGRGRPVGSKSGARN